MIIVTWSNFRSYNVCLSFNAQSVGQKLANVSKSANGSLLSNTVSMVSVKAKMVH